MTFSSETIKAEIKSVLFSLEEETDPTVFSKAQTILYANLDRGRIQRFIGEDISRVEEYSNRVLSNYQSLSPYLHQLQISQNAEAWLPLYKELQQWAYNFFLGKGFYPSRETEEIAISCATDAATEILEAHFPYDTEFKPWAHVILQNVCRKHIRKSMKKSNIPQEKLSGLNEVNHTLSTLSLNDAHEEKQQKDIQEEIRAAVEHLAKSRKLFIELYYFQEKSLAEIAEEMGKTVNAIYGLHFNALKDLRKILDQNRNRLDE